MQTSFLQRFPLRSRSIVLLAFKESASVKLAPTAIVEDVLLRANCALCVPGYYRDLAAWKMLRDTLSYSRDDGAAFAALIRARIGGQP